MCLYLLLFLEATEDAVLLLTGTVVADSPPGRQSYPLVQPGLFRALPLPLLACLVARVLLQEAHRGLELRW